MFVYFYLTVSACVREVSAIVCEELALIFSLLTGMLDGEVFMCDMRHHQTEGPFTQSV